MAEGLYRGSRTSARPPDGPAAQPASGSLPAHSVSKQATESARALLAAVEKEVSWEGGGPFGLDPQPGSARRQLRDLCEAAVRASFQHPSFTEKTLAGLSQDLHRWFEGADAPTRLRLVALWWTIVHQEPPEKPGPIATPSPVPNPKPNPKPKPKRK